MKCKDGHHWLIDKTRWVEECCPVKCRDCGKTGCNCDVRAGDWKLLDGHWKRIK
jgi:hypothetical protein